MKVVRSSTTARKVFELSSSSELISSTMFCGSAKRQSGNLDFMSMASNCQLHAMELTLSFNLMQQYWKLASFPIAMSLIN